MTEREIRKLELGNGRVPFDDWFESLGDLRMQAAVDARLARVRAGNFGDHKGVGAGVAGLLRRTSQTACHPARWRGQGHASARHQPGEAIVAAMAGR